MRENPASSLAGKRIVITRAMTVSEELARELADRGAIPLVFPLVSFAEPEDFDPLDRAIDEIAQFDWLILTSVRAVRAIAVRTSESGRLLGPAGSTWHAAIAGLAQFDWLILTSAEAVRAVARRSKKRGYSLEQAWRNLQLASVGPVTAEEAKRNNLRVHYVARTHNGLALAQELGARMQGKKVLLPRSDRAKRDLPEALRHLGAEVTEVIAYRTLKLTESNQTKFDEIASGEADAILFFSPSAVEHFGETFGNREIRALQDKVAITAVGPVTAKALREAGVERVIVSADTTAAAVVEALEKHFAAAKAAPAGAKQA